MVDRIWLSSPHMSCEGYEREYVREAFDSNWIAPLGANVDAFEKEFAARVGAGHAAALASGTAAIHMALKASGVGPGDIVFCPTLTFSASADPILYQGAVPVFIDSDFRTWNMDPEALNDAFRKYPQARAVIVVHLYGLSADLDPILELCRSHGTALIEDAAESLGTTYKGQSTGTFGDFGAFSFNGNKIITTSGGGMLVSDNGERIRKVLFWSSQSKDKSLYYQHSEIGYNYRMSNISAGIGRGQMKVLDERIEKKRYIFDFYRKELGELPGVDFMPVNEWNEPNCWLSCLTVRGSVTPIEIVEALAKENIESRPVWRPMHMQPLYEKCDYFGGTVSEKLFENGLCLPSDTKMTDEDLGRVCRIVKSRWEG